MVVLNDCMVRLDKWSNPNKQEEAMEAQTKVYFFVLNIFKNAYFIYPKAKSLKFIFIKEI